LKRWPRALKAQVNAIDLVLAISIFMLIMGLFEVTWQGSVSRAAPTEDELSLRSYHVANTLLESGGYPEDWNSSDVQVLGLCDERNVINKNKLAKLLVMLGSDYSRAKGLLGVGANDIYINVTDLSGDIIYVNGVRASAGIVPTSAQVSMHSASIALISSLTHTNNSIAVLFDQSGSMADSLPDSQSKIDAAKSATNDFTLYLVRGDEMALTSFTSCSDAYTAANFTTDMNDMRFAISGMTTHTWSPLALAINHTGEYMNQSAGNANWIMIVLADGNDTCGGNVTEAALHAEDKDVDIIHAIGIDVPAGSQAEAELMDIARAGGGNYYRANDSDSIYESLIRAYESGEKEVVVNIVIWR